MTVTQVYTILNTIAGEMLGEGVVVNEDLSNVVDIGNQFTNVVGLDNYVKKLNDVIGKMVFVDRVYSGRAPSVLMDGWEYGSILEKISADLPQARENESWNLTDGQSYDTNIFYKPSVSVKCWNKRTTFEVDISITERQVKSSFNSAAQLNAFYSMIQTAIQNKMTVCVDGLIMRTINNFIGETVAAEYTDKVYNNKSGIRAVNLLYLYNQENPEATLTAATAINNPNFIRFAAKIMLNYVDRISTMSTLFNVGGKERFTPRDRLHFVTLSEFTNAANIYLQSDTYHNEYTRLPKSDNVAYWQGSGTGYAFADTSKIDIKTASGAEVALSGILGVMFDRDALGVTNYDRRVTSNYVAKAEFWNEYHKQDCGYFNDTNENGVVFFVA